MAAPTIAPPTNAHARVLNRPPPAADEFVTAECSLLVLTGGDIAGVVALA